MASVKFQKGSKEWAMFQEYWRICQAYWIPEPNNDDYWKNLFDDVNGFHNKYKDIPLSQHIALGFLDAINELTKKGKANDN